MKAAAIAAGNIEWKVYPFWVGFLVFTVLLPIIFTSFMIVWECRSQGLGEARAEMHRKRDELNDQMRNHEEPHKIAIQYGLVIKAEKRCARKEKAMYKAIYGKYPMSAFRQ